MEGFNFFFLSLFLPLLCPPVSFLSFFWTGGNQVGAAYKLLSDDEKRLECERSGRARGGGPEFDVRVDLRTILEALRVISAELDLAALASKARQAFPARPADQIERDVGVTTGGIDWLSLFWSAIQAVRRRFRGEGGTVDWSDAMVTVQEATKDEQGRFDLRKAFRSFSEAAQAFLSNPTGSPETPPSAADSKDSKERRPGGPTREKEL